MKVDLVSLIIGVVFAAINMVVLIMLGNDSSILVDAFFGAEGACVGIVVRNMFGK